MTPSESPQKKITPEQAHGEALAEYITKQRENHANEAANFYAQLKYLEVQHKDELEMKDHQIKALQDQLEELQQPSVESLNES